MNLCGKRETCCTDGMSTCSSDVIHLFDWKSAVEHDGGI